MLHPRACCTRHAACARMVARAADPGPPPVVQALVPHVSAQHAPVCSQARNGDAHVVVDLEDLALEGRELRLRALDGAQHRVRVALRQRGGHMRACAGARGLLHGRMRGGGRAGGRARACGHRVRTRSPTAQLPCFTASMAYSTWNRRPWGLQVVTSVSYCRAERGGGRGLLLRALPGSQAARQHDAAITGTHLVAEHGAGSARGGVEPGCLAPLAGEGLLRQAWQSGRCQGGAGRCRAAPNAVRGARRPGVSDTRAGAAAAETQRAQRGLPWAHPATTAAAHNNPGEAPRHACSRAPPPMVFYFTPRNHTVGNQNYLIYMGRDK